MAISSALIVHIGAGSLGILSGFGALAVAKGEPMHRALGTVFFIGMLIMSGMGAMLAVFVPQRATIVIGIFTFYLVATAWAAVKRPEGTIGRFEVASFFVVLACGVALVTLGLMAAASPTGRIDGFPASLHYIFAGFTAIAAVSDLRVIRRGGVSGGARIARHLWRMCAALLLASFSFFLGQQKVMPLFMRGSPLFYVPELIVLGSMIFWLIYVAFAKRYRVPSASLSTVAARATDHA
jgi:hypothetical protein